MRAALVGTREGKTLPRRCLDTFWIATWRDKARLALRNSRESLARAERCFDDAAYWAGQGARYDRLAADWAESGLRALTTARADRREARRCAKAALTGCLD